jgi:hypothetical protein
VEHLEPAPPPHTDTYDRSQPALGPLTIDGVEKFIIDKIVRAETRHDKQGYIVKWLSYSNETTFELRENLLRDVPKLLEKIEKKRRLRN